MGAIIDIRFVNATRKDHDCFGCAETIKAGAGAFANAALNDEGRMETVYLCPRCCFYANRIADFHAQQGKTYKLEQGKLKEQLIPNKVRKQFKEFIASVEEQHRAGLLNPSRSESVFERNTMRPRSLVVKREDCKPSRHLLWLPAKRYKMEDFPSGRVLKLRGGVASDAIERVVKMARAISKETAAGCLGRNEPMIGVLFCR